MEILPGRPGSETDREMSLMLVAPSEPKPLLALGKSCQVPEHYGSDFLLASEAIGLIGIQRKQFPEDFIASLRGNDRISRELQLMKRLDYGVWLLEGLGSWTNDGFLVYGGRYKYFEKELWGFHLSVGLMGYQVVRVRDQNGTIEFLRHFQQWAAKESHNSLLSRPKPGRWGEPGSNEWALHFLQGIPGIGHELAKRILDKFGEVPFRGSFEYDEMASAIGPGRAKTVCNLFGVEIPKKGK